jgi:hypothetical protein
VQDPAEPGGQLVAQVQVFEDHDLPGAMRPGVWRDLVDWVTWLHDAYELSFGEALPPCWPAHPGLVRELAALRAWRAEIYQPFHHPVTGRQAPRIANGGLARAWHAELRNVLRAAQNMYAVGCRAGHRPAPRTLAGDTHHRATWLDQHPEVIPSRGNRLPWDHPQDPPPAPRPAAPGGARVASQQEIDDARAAGTTRELGPQATDYTHHQGSWWAHHPHGHWVQIGDPATSARLDRAAAAWATAQNAVTSPGRPPTRGTLRPGRP